jgi:K+ transporter
MQTNPTKFSVWLIGYTVACAFFVIITVRGMGLSSQIDAMCVFGWLSLAHLVPLVVLMVRYRQHNSLFIIGTVFFCFAGASALLLYVSYVGVQYIR